MSDVINTSIVVGMSGIFVMVAAKYLVDFISDYFPPFRLGDCE